LFVVSGKFSFVDASPGKLYNEADCVFSPLRCATPFCLRGNVGIIDNSA
jgi:hypothetical protein